MLRSSTSWPALIVSVTLSAQMVEVPRGMYCGGNQLVSMGLLRAVRVAGKVVDPTGALIPRARVQVQIQGHPEILRDIEADERGRSHLPHLQAGIYWLGVSSPGFNLHFWALQIDRHAGKQTLTVELSVGT